VLLLLFFMFCVHCYRGGVGVAFGFSGFSVLPSEPLLPPVVDGSGVSVGMGVGVGVGV
jgi:hypothetical protein